MLRQIRNKFDFISIYLCKNVYSFILLWVSSQCLLIAHSNSAGDKVCFWLNCSSYQYTVSTFTTTSQPLVCLLEMKFFETILNILFLFSLLHHSMANLCACDLTLQDMVCGSNSITYRNRCEFECTQREYKKLGKILKLQKNGHC